MENQVPSYIREAGQKASEAAGVAGQYAGSGYSIGDILSDKISRAYSENQDIVNQLDKNTQNYFSAPSEARVKYENIFNPFQRENLVSQYVGNQALPMLSSANILGSRMGGIADLVRSGVAGFQSLIAQKQAEAEAANQEYNRLLNEFQINEALNATTTQEMTFGGNKYLVTLDRNGNIIKKELLGPSGEGSGVGDLTSALAALGIKLPGNESSVVTDQPKLDQYWEDTIGFQDLTNPEKTKALQISATSNKSLDDIAKDIYDQRGKSSEIQSGSIYGATGTPAANVDYSGLEYTGFNL